MSSKILLLLIFFLHGINSMNMTITGYIACRYNQKFSYRMELLQRHCFVFEYYDLIDQQLTRNIYKGEADKYNISGTFESSFWTSTFTPKVRIHHTCTSDGEEGEDFFILKQEYSTNLKSAEVKIHINLPDIPRHKERAIITHENNIKEELPGDPPVDTTEQARYRLISERVIDLLQSL